jgi:hypothetical protein
MVTPWIIFGHRIFEVITKNPGRRPRGEQGRAVLELIA